MQSTDLRADCSSCFGLCCVALTFSRSADFAIDKPAGEACPNLSADFRCGIHDDPFFFDAGAFATLESTLAGFPRAPGAAKNFFGPNVEPDACMSAEGTGYARWDRHPMRRCRDCYRRCRS